jgi:hypothetical protein
MRSEMVVLLQLHAIHNLGTLQAQKIYTLKTNHDAASRTSLCSATKDSCNLRVQNFLSCTLLESIKIQSLCYLKF